MWWFGEGNKFVEINIGGFTVVCQYYSIETVLIGTLLAFLLNYQNKTTVNISRFTVVYQGCLIFRAEPESQ